MTLLQCALSLICVLGISSGQILFKLAATHIVIPTNFTELLQLCSNFYLLAALSLYAFITGLWIWTLRITPLPIAYPIQALAFLIVPLLDYLFIGEAISLKTMIGGMVIIVGICISVISL